MNFVLSLLLISFSLSTFAQDNQQSPTVGIFKCVEGKGCSLLPGLSDWRKNKKASECVEKAGCNNLTVIQDQQECFKKCDFNPNLFSCEERCGQLLNAKEQKTCFKNCEAQSKVFKIPSTGIMHLPYKANPCDSKCFGIRDMQEQGACYESCSSLSSIGCERTDAQTITCADGVYKKAADVNGEQIIKEVGADEKGSRKKKKSKADKQ